MTTKKRLVSGVHMVIPRYLLVVLIVLARQVDAADSNQDLTLMSGWTEATLAEFVAGCTEGVVAPARRDYAAAAERAGNTSPKPFPEMELRASVQPMCSCLSIRVAETWDYSDYILQPQDKSRAFMEEALAGGRCKPGGILGEVLERARSQTPN